MAYTLQDNYDSSNNDAIMNGVSWLATTFTAGSAYTISRVDTPLYRKASAVGTITVSIRGTTSNLPSGADLASGTIAVSSLPTSNDGTNWLRVDLTVPLALTNGVVYAIVVRTSDSGDANHACVWREQTSGAYAGGQHCRSSNSGGSWTGFSTIDTAFRTYSGSDVTYEELAATGGGTSGGSAEISVAEALELAATGGSTSGGSAALTAYGYGSGNSAGFGILVAAGNDQLWFEQI